MKKSRLNAVILERVLVIGILPLIGVSAFIVYSLFGILEEKAMQASHASIDSEVGTSNINHLKELEAGLARNQDIATRAAAIVAESKQYGYQDQIVNDINTYAQAAGVTILGFDFSETGGASTTPGAAGSSAGTASSGQTATTPTTPTPATDTTKAPAAAPGLKTVNASIQLDSPIPLTNFLIFLKYIEQNVTKMQITGVTITPEATNPNLISNPTINLTVYTR